MFGEHFKGLGLDIWGYQVPSKSKRLEPSHHQGVSSIVTRIGDQSGLNEFDIAKRKFDRIPNRGGRFNRNVI